MSVRFSLNHFPLRAEVKDNSGIPWGCVLQPFKRDGVDALDDVDVRTVARCGKCFAYMNPYIRSLHSGWECSLCQKTNSYTPRYSSRTERRECKELHHANVEYNVAADVEEAKPAVFLAMVDVTGQETVMDLIKEGLRAAIQSLPASAYFGLLSFSDDVGLYDLASTLPHVKYLCIPESGECVLGFDEIMPFSRLFVRIGTHEGDITRAIDSIVSLAPQVSMDPDAASRRLKRGFGAAMAGVVEYFALYKDTIAAGRVMSFLGGLPNYGPGCLRENDDDALLPLRSDGHWYRTMGKAAVKAGLAVDLFITSAAYVNLPTLYPLATLTGGNVCNYPDLKLATLPQDIYRLYGSAIAARGLLRIRTSYGYKVDRCFGHIHPDPHHDDLFHLGGCNEWKALAFDFAFTHASSFDVRRNNASAAVQVAFSFTRIPSRKEEEARGGPIRPTRKLRIQTLQVPISRNYGQLYREMDPEVVITLLLHKVLIVARAEHVRQARELLVDWLIMLLSHYLQTRPSAGPGSQPSVSERIRTILSRYPNIRKVALYVYSLLQSKALDVGVDADTLTYLHCLYSSVGPAILRRALYPDVYCFSSPDTILSENAVRLSLPDVVCEGVSIVLLDAYTTICVYYILQRGLEADSRPPPVTSSATEPDGRHGYTSTHLMNSEEFPSTPSLLYPPPKGSVLRSMCVELRQAPHLSPCYVVTKTGLPGETAVFEMLVEDGRGGSSTENFAQFVKKCMVAVDRLAS